MKDLYAAIHNGGDEAVAAVQRIGEDWRLQLEAAAAEVERLRAQVKLLDAAHAASHSGFMVMAGGFENAVATAERLRLTDAEREAVETSFDAMQYAADELGLSQADCDRLAATLRGLLERMR